MLPPDDIQTRVQKARKYPLWESYFAIGESDRIFNVHEIYKETQKNMVVTHIISGILVMVIALLNCSGKEEVNSALKFLRRELEIASILFLMALIFNQMCIRNVGGQPITASELRYA